MIETSSDVVVAAILKHASYHGRGSAHDMALHVLGHQTGPYVQKFTSRGVTLGPQFFETFRGIEQYMPEDVIQQLHRDSREPEALDS